MTPVERASILLADDHPAALAQAAHVLGDRYEIVGTAANGLELLAAAERLAPDVIVLDIAMPGLDGLEAARRLIRDGCRSRLVFLTVWADPDYLREALEIGAAGYVVKSHLASDLVPAVAAALAGKRFVSPGIPDGHPSPRT
ncbi:MAG TPA: response regulator transcription factor [Gemmatimonadales bacterium]